MADTQPVSPVAHGTAVFAGVLLIIAGAFQALEALAAIVNDKYLVVLPQYIYAFDLTLWGWIHLLVGLGLLAIGIALLRGQTWARMAGIVTAVTSASSTSPGCRIRPGGRSWSSALTSSSSGRSPRTCASPT